jgi:hypothetical protein
VNPLTAVKLALAALGIVVFGYGVRIDSTAVRWVGVGLVAVAALLRFVGPRSSRERR